MTTDIGQPDPEKTFGRAEDDDLLDVLNTLDDPECADQYILWCGYRPLGPDQSRQDEVAERVRQHNERVLARSVSEREGD